LFLNTCDFAPQKTGRPDDVFVKKVAKHILITTIQNFFFCGKSRLKYWATSVIKKKLPKVPKQSANIRKIAQSGHPVRKQKHFKLYFH
jgi:hypothetical protein